MIHKCQVSWPPEKNLKMVICFGLSFRGTELIWLLHFVCGNVLHRDLNFPCVLEEAKPKEYVPWPWYVVKC